MNGPPFCCSLLALSLSITSVHAQAHAQQDNKSRQSKPLYQDIQQALEALTRAEVAREEASLSREGNPKLEAAREQCRQSVVKLFSLDAAISKLLHQSYQVRPSQRDENSWTTQELESLSRNLKVQLARGYRNQALCYPENSIDRINSLSIALEHLPEIVNQPIDDPSIWQGRLEQIACLRLLGKHEASRTNIAKWQQTALPANIKSRLQGESLRLALAEHNVDDALHLIRSIQSAHKQSSSTTPETDEAILEALLFARKQAIGDETNRFLQQAVSQLQHIAKVHGPYWQRRAEFRLGRALADSFVSDDPKLLQYAAASAYASGNYTQAINYYDRIASLQAAQKDLDGKFQSLKTAAAIVHKQQISADALRRFRQLAIQHSDHEEAASVHLIAIRIATKLARDAPSERRAESFERYLQLLNEHLQRWPDQTSAKQVKQWLGRAELPEIERRRAEHLARQGDRQAAITLYRKLLKDKPNDAALMEACAELLALEIEGPELREALALYGKIEQGSQPGSPRWWRGRRARITLLERLGEDKQAEKLKQLTEILYSNEASSE